MREFFLIDAGSSSIKLYSYAGDKAQLLTKVSYSLTKSYLTESELSSEDQEVLIALFCNLKDKYRLTRSNTKVYATGHFRKMTNIGLFRRNLYFATGLCFYTITQELETFYLEKLFTSYSNNESRVLVFNIGSGSIELVFMNNERVVERKMIDFGVKMITKEVRPDINDVSDSAVLYEVVDKVKSMLPCVSDLYDTAFYTGGELTFMRRCHYPLATENNCKDRYHPCWISYSDYCKYNETLFSQMTICDLHGLMPDNPSWMDGARACSAIAQAICEKYSVQRIIPSDFNMVDGICVQQARNVVICGSFRRSFDMISKLMTELNRAGINVINPKSTVVTGEMGGFVLLKDDHPINGSSYSIEVNHLDAIANEKCDMVIVCNCGDYIGDSTSMEIGYALAFGKRIVFLNNNGTSQSLDGPFEIGLIGEFEDCQ